MLHVFSKTTMYGILVGLFIAIHYSHTLGMEIIEEKALLRELDENTLRMLGFTINSAHTRGLLNGSDKYKENSTYDTPGTFTVTDLQDYHYSMKYKINGDDIKLAENLSETWNAFVWIENTTICCRIGKIDNVHIRRLFNDQYKDNSTYDTPGFFDVTGLQEYPSQRKYAMNGVKLAGYISKSWNVLMWKENTTTTICCSAFMRSLLNGSDQYKDNSTFDTPGFFDVIGLQEYPSQRKYAMNGVKLAVYISILWNVQSIYSERSRNTIAGVIKKHSPYVYVNRNRYNGYGLFLNYKDFSSEDLSYFSRKYDLEWLMAWLMYDEEITLSTEFVWHPNAHYVVGKDYNEMMFETSAKRICHVSGLALKMLNRINILDHVIRIGFLAINKFKGVIWLFALLWIISWKLKVDLLETKEHQSKALPGTLNKTTSLEHKDFQDFQRRKKGNDKRIMEINEQILSILHHLDHEMKIRESKRPHSSI